MASRAPDWSRQAVGDLEQAADSQRAGRHEWACLAAQQAAEKAVKALHLRLEQEAWGQMVGQLLAELPSQAKVRVELAEKAKVLDNFCMPARHLNGLRLERRSNITGLYRGIQPSNMPVSSLSLSVLKGLTGRPSNRRCGRGLPFRPCHALAFNASATSVPMPEATGSVGSDLEVVGVMEKSSQRFNLRATGFDTTGLPVPTDLLVYTRSESEALIGSPSRFARQTRHDILRVFRLD